MRKYFLYKKNNAVQIAWSVADDEVSEREKIREKSSHDYIYIYFFLGFLAKMFSIIKTTITTWQRLQ